MERKILIIKLSALGDVLRTTPILRVLNGEITWITKKEAIPLLKTELIHRLIDIGNKNQLKKLKKEKFNLVLSVDEDIKAAEIASEIRTKKLIGIYLSPHPIPPPSRGRSDVLPDDTSGLETSETKEGGKITYTNDSKKWFDMSLISRFGIKKANELKRVNRLSYQEHLFNMLGKKFKSEEYVLNIKPKRINSTVIGIEKRAGEKWPAKQWLYYNELVQKLKKDGYTVKILRQRKSLNDYIKDINECNIIVCGDTLAMHLGIALQKKVIALFTCTSPDEIYVYSRTTKVVSPKLNKFFYRRKFVYEASASISLNEVYEAVKK